MAPKNTNICKTRTLTWYHGFTLSKRGSVKVVHFLHLIALQVYLWVNGTIINATLTVKKIKNKKQQQYDELAAKNIMQYEQTDDPLSRNIFNMNLYYYD